MEISGGSDKLALTFIVVHTSATFIAGRSLARTVDELENRWGDLSLATLVPPEVDRLQNRAPLIRAALELVTLDKDEQSIASAYDSLDTSAPPAADAALLDELLERHRLAFELLAEAARRPESNWYIPYHKGVTADIPPLLEFLQLSRLNLARTVRALDRGDTQAAVAAVEQGFAMTESFSGEPVLIVQLIRVAADRLNAGALRALLSRAELDADTLDRLQPLVARMAAADPIRIGMLGEMKAFYHQLDRIEDESFGPDDPWILRFGALAWLMRPVIRADLRFYLHHMETALKHQELPAHARQELVTDKPRFYHLISRTALPNLENAILRGDLFAARAELARTALALERQRAERGSYPERLGQLVPVYLESVPVDPLSGEPLIYAATPGGYRLASAGDGKLQPMPRPLDQVLRWDKQ